MHRWTLAEPSRQGWLQWDSHGHQWASRDSNDHRWTAMESQYGSIAKKYSRTSIFFLYFNNTTHPFSYFKPSGQRQFSAPVRVMQNYLDNKTDLSFKNLLQEQLRSYFRFNLVFLVIDVYQKWRGPCKATVVMFRRIKNELRDDLLGFAMAQADNISALNFYGGNILVLRGTVKPKVLKNIINYMKYFVVNYFLTRTNVMTFPWDHCAPRLPCWVFLENRQLENFAPFAHSLSS